jgi:cytidylate kinase
VAIDGPVGSGKSTVARSLAAALGWQFLDTGAMYRAVTVEARRRGLELSDAERVGELAESVVIETVPRVTVDGHDVEDELRTPDTNAGVSVVATLPRVRAAMVAQQRAFARRHAEGIVVEGRDITTVVFPDARLKVFLTASLEERTRRRGDEDEVSIRRRDAIDSGRAISPLRQADDARIVDTTGRTVVDVVEEILRCLTAIA